MFAVLVTVNVLLTAKVPVFEKLTDAAPLIVGDPEILTLLLPNAAVPAPKMDCKLPPFKLNTPVPKAFVVLFAANVPLVNVTVPVKLVFAPSNSKMPVVAFSVSAPEPLPNAAAKSVVPVFVTVNVLPEANVTLLLKVTFFDPTIVGVELFTVVLLLPNVAVPLPRIDCNVPPLKLNAPVPNAFVALFNCKMPALNVVALL